MSDNERFTLYKYYECLVNKLIKIIIVNTFIQNNFKYLISTSNNKYEMYKINILDNNIYR